MILATFMYNYMNMTSEEPKNPASPSRDSRTQSLDSEGDPESGFVSGWNDSERTQRRNREIEQNNSEVRFQPVQQVPEPNSAAAEEEER